METQNVSKDESLLTEKIFMLQMSISFLKKGRRPFHNEAIKILGEKVKKLKLDSIIS